MKLSPADNVVVALRTLKPGESIVIDGVLVTLPRGVAVGHKLAARAIAQGEIVVKYGCPIGTAMRAIAPGEHVHTHNLRSDYRPPHILSP
jgi:hypothetical protein